ncbi:MAG: hypothetical protein HN849_20975 [Victivallales bacterium]|nr:hypothetical protein [Victivallales bacterium]
MNELRIGWASRNISTDKPVDIPGQFHTRVSQGVIDPITVTALVIDNGSDLVVFLSADLVSIRPYLLEEIRAKVADMVPGLPVEKILMSCTHTHAGASYYKSNQVSMAKPEQFPHPDIEITPGDEYRAFLVAQTAEAIGEAFRRRAPGGIAYGYGYAAIAHSRRVVYFDDLAKRPDATGRPGMIVAGHAAMYGNTNDDKFSHYEAGTDHFINLLYTFDQDGRLTGGLVNVPCPSQNSESEWRLSADYWHDVRVALRKKHGDIFLLPQCAAAGDLAPRIMHYRQAQERRFRLKYGPEDPGVRELKARWDIAERIADAFDEVLDWAKKDIQTALPVTHTVDTIDLSRRVITDEERSREAAQLAELNAIEFASEGTPREKLIHDSTLVARRNRCQRILDRYEDQQKQPKVQMELHVLRIGDVAFASNSFELYMDYMHRIQARSPFCQTFVVQLAGTPTDCGGYLTTERGAWGKGYSASLYCNQVSPEGGQELVEETVQRLKAIHSQERPEQSAPKGGQEDGASPEPPPGGLVSPDPS